MPNDYTPAELKSWITKLLAPNTPEEELKRIAMTLAHLDNPEALRALEEFRQSPRAEEVEWIDMAVDESSYFVLSPSNEREQKDYIRVELWQEYEEELLDKMGQRGRSAQATTRGGERISRGRDGQRAQRRHSPAIADAT